MGDRGGLRLTRPRTGQRPGLLSRTTGVSVGMNRPSSTAGVEVMLRAASAWERDAALRV